ncbi:MAG: UDP-N-acetylmuramoyl-L-alanyl-D-glutamate--2,6-diaminopimelate ligase [Acidimicrobiia bacterium]|nr:UDP-N-acetylmuramoyl-L-alanyl-D-glutamate--2,6-diaminopimelate ligase [Acidimicrobiia bacterium]
MASSRSVSLSSLATAIEPAVAGIQCHGDAAVSDVHIDSREVVPGSLYVAIRGSRADGHDFVATAVDRGARAVVVDKPPSLDVPHLMVADTRQALGWIAAEVHGRPAESLALTGITGTNGKTTVAHMLAAMAPSESHDMAVVGTVSANLDGVPSSPRTTPEANDLHRTLRRLADGGRITDVALEVSSHAMEMGRVNGCRFDVVAFTNLSQDHLDYHGTMEAYFQAKARLFSAAWAPAAVIWTDDDWGKRLAGETELPVISVGTSDACDIVVHHRADTPEGSTFSVEIDGVEHDGKTALAGRFNVANAAIALACAWRKGWDVEGCLERLAEMPPIPGRYNTVANALELWVVVDYAHTPDAISGIIAEARSLVAGRVIAVGGAGGDRDQEKRPLMGAALAGADLTVVTTDNPRSEDPELILEQVLSGIGDRDGVVVEPDRRKAIRVGLLAATAGDAVLLLGKGHESSQEFADRVVPFDDATVAREELAALEGVQQ